MYAESIAKKLLIIVPKIINKLIAEQVESMVVDGSSSKYDEGWYWDFFRLGIDKISRVKWQEKFIVVLVKLLTHKLLGLTPEIKHSKI